MQKVKREHAYLLTPSQLEARLLTPFDLGDNSNAFHEKVKKIVKSFADDYIGRFLVLEAARRRQQRPHALVLGPCDQLGQFPIAGGVIPDPGQQDLSVHARAGVR